MVVAAVVAATVVVVAVGVAAVVVVASAVAVVLVAHLVLGHCSWCVGRTVYSSVMGSCY